MNRFVSPLGLIRWAGAALLGCVVAVLGQAAREGSSGRAAFQDYTFVMGVGLVTAIVSFTVVGVGLLLARPAAPERDREPADQVDHWA